MSSGPTRVVVVVPARNEEKRLDRCLAAVQRSSEYLFSRAETQRIQVEVHVVLDCCTDRSALIAGRHSQATATVDINVHHVDNGRVGAARDAGVRSALRVSRAPTDTTWIACTDADSAVSQTWLQTHVELAHDGAEMVLGTVRLDRAEISAFDLSWWEAHHDPSDDHPHVYGANLGIRADTYVEVGGFAHVTAHEDVRLAAAVRQAGGRVVSTGRSPVTTSARRSGRSASGLADYLHRMPSHARR
jgi:glycosyltransferase involved in cell wall biosynthesis